MERTEINHLKSDEAYKLEMEKLTKTAPDSESGFRDIEWKPELNLWAVFGNLGVYRLIVAHTKTLDAAKERLSNEYGYNVNELLV